MFFVASFWSIYWQIENLGQKFQVISYIFLSLLLCIPYSTLLKKKVPLTSWHFGAFIIALTAISSPIVLQTDEWRYIWDGINSSLGINPYRFPPLEHPLYEKFSWTKFINHPQLPTIYPPAAQLIFWMSTYLNIFFYNPILNITFMPDFGPLGQWQLFFGLKLLMGISSVLTIFFLKNKRWDLIVFHPAYLILAAGNSHIDAFLIPSFIIIFSSLYSKNHERWQNIAFTLGILIKWIPIILLPGIFLLWKRKWGILRSSTALLLSCIFIIFGLFIFLKSSDGGLFLSLKTYTDKWYFFGFIHRFLLDILTSFNIKSAYNLSKLLCALVGLLWAFTLFYNYIRKKISFRLFSLWLFLGLFIVSPTIHPWYLLILLPLWLPYKGIFHTPVLWPVLGIFSKSYFIDNNDPEMIRYSVYLIISLTLFLDLKKLFKFTLRN